MAISTFFRVNTPIEVYSIGVHKVRVKREDLFASDPAPSLSKLRGLSILLDKLVAEKIQIVKVHFNPCLVVNAPKFLIDSNRI